MKNILIKKSFWWILTNLKDFLMKMADFPDVILGGLKIIRKRIRKMMSNYIGLLQI